MNAKKNLIINTLASTNYIVLNKTLIAKLGLEAAGYLSILIDEYRYFEATNRLTENEEFTITREKIKKTTLIKLKAQRRIEKKLVDCALITITRKKVPAQNYYIINTDALIKMMEHTHTENAKQPDVPEGNIQMCQKGTSRSAKREHLEVPKGNILHNNNYNNNYNNNNIIYTHTEKRHIDDSDFDYYLDNPDNLNHYLAELQQLFPRITEQFLINELETAKEWHNSIPKSKKKKDFKLFMRNWIMRSYGEFLRTMREEAYLARADAVGKPKTFYRQDIEDRQAHMRAMEEAIANIINPNALSAGVG